MRSLIDITDLSANELGELIKTAMDIIERPEDYSQVCRGKKLATLFYEPSTRTRCSFEVAMMDLGGYVLSTTDAGKSSAAKGESIADTAKIISLYTDIMALRHPMAGSVLVAARNASVPVINAGDGSHFHPTQTLADILTIYREKGRLENLNIGLCGDLKYGRTVHSLINAMSKYKGVSYTLISPEELALPDYGKKVITCAGQKYIEAGSIESVLPSLDLIYMTRIQQERFDDPGEYERLKNLYILTPDIFKSAKKDCIIMHPLPRLHEISTALDEDPRAAYFRQALNGKYMRMALILKLLKSAEKSPVREGLPSGTRLAAEDKRHCRNPKCITKLEQNLPEEIHGDGLCIYCDSTVV